MRHFTFTLDSLKSQNPQQQIQYYCKLLEQDINSISNYIQLFSPNYKILNYNVGTSTSYYSDVELFEKEYMIQAYVLDLETYQEGINNPEIWFDSVTNQPKGDSTIMIFPNQLELHEGLLNRFPEYDKSSLGVLLYYGAKDEVVRSVIKNDQTYYFVPETILSYDLTKPIWNFCTLDSSLTNLDDLRFLNQEDEGDSLIWSDLRLCSDIEELAPYAPSAVQRFEPAYIIISLAREEQQEDTPSASARLTKSNYLYCRLAGAGSYYYPSWYDKWIYTDKAIDIYGSTIILTAANTQLRYSAFIKTLWENAATQQLFHSYSRDYNSDNDYNFYIKTIKGAAWTLNQLLSHRLVYQHDTNIYDTFFVDDCASTAFVNVDSMKVPSYNINIQYNTQWSLSNVQTILW